MRTSPEPLGRNGLAVGAEPRAPPNRPPGAFDVPVRLRDLDEEGVWGEVVYPSIGLWAGLIRILCCIGKASASSTIG